MCTVRERERGAVDKTEGRQESEQWGEGEGYKYFKIELK